jgi:hypothetical protein
LDVNEKSQLLAKRRQGLIALGYGFKKVIHADCSWKGMTWEVLTKQGWYDRWLQVEKDFALARYKDIIEVHEFMNEVAEQLRVV